MRIAYVVPWSERFDAGVMKNKVDLQLDYWRRAGHEVRVFMLRWGDEDATTTTPGGPHIVVYHGMRARPGAVVCSCGTGGSGFRSWPPTTGRSIGRAWRRG